MQQSRRLNFVGTGTKRRKMQELWVGGVQRIDITVVKVQGQPFYTVFPSPQANMNSALYLSALSHVPAFLTRRSLNEAVQMRHYCRAVILSLGRVDEGVVWLVVDVELDALVVSRAPAFD